MIKFLPAVFFSFALIISSCSDSSNGEANCLVEEGWYVSETSANVAQQCRSNVFKTDGTYQHTCNAGFFAEVSEDRKFAWCRDANGLISAGYSSSSRAPACATSEENRWVKGYGRNGKLGAIRCHKTYWDYYTNDAISCVAGFEVRISDSKGFAWCADANGIPSAQVAADSGNLSECDIAQPEVWEIGYTKDGTLGAIQCVDGKLGKSSDNNFSCPAGQRAVIAGNQSEPVCE